LLLILGTSPSYAWFSSRDAGSCGFPLLEDGVGVRAAAMGEAFTGLCDDATALYWNPAGLARLNRYELTATHQQWFLDTRDEYVGGTILASPFTLGISALYSGNPGIVFYDEHNNPIDTVTTHSGYATIGAGYKLERQLSLGLAVKGLYDNLQVEHATGLCGDVGLLAGPFPLGSPLPDPRPLNPDPRVPTPDPRPLPPAPFGLLSFGLAVQNIGPDIRYGDATYPLPLAIRTGAAWQWRDLKVASDFVLGKDRPPEFHIGAEYLFYKIAALRAGFRTGPQDMGTLGALSGLSLGCGIFYHNLVLEYAFVPNGALGDVHRFGLRMAFYPPGEGSLRLTVIDLLTHKPVQANVTISGVLGYSGATNRQGKLNATQLSNGWLKIHTGADLYASRLDSILVEGTGEQQLTLTLARIGQGGVWGMITDEDRQPIGGKIEYHGPVSGTIIADSLGGSYLLKSLPCGEYTFRITSFHDAFVAQSCTLDVAPEKIGSQDFILKRRSAETKSLQAR
jgi:hypothetical protein